MDDSVDDKQPRQRSQRRREGENATLPFNLRQGPGTQSIIHSFILYPSLSPQYPTSAKAYLHKFYNAPLAPVSRVFDAIINEQDVRIAVKLNRSINNHSS